MAAGPALGMSRFAIIENRGPNNLADFLKSRLAKAKAADFAVSFISHRGLSTIRAVLSRVAGRGRVRILTGLYQEVTEPKALRALLRAQRQSRQRLTTRLSANPKFHQKLYLVKQRARLEAIVGSSNLTREGLTSDGEFAALVSFPVHSSAARKLCDSFERQWKNHSRELTNARIQLYEKRYRALHKRGFPRNLPSLRVILKSDEQPPERREERSLWREWCEGTAKDETAEIIKDSTDWNGKGYGWQTTSAHRMKEGDRLLLLDFTDRRVRLVDIKDTTEISTPDGRYFIAYKPLRNRSQRHFTRGLWSELKALGVARSQKEARSRRRRISIKTWQDLQSAFAKR